MRIPARTNCELFRIWLLILAAKNDDLHIVFGQWCYLPNCPLALYSFRRADNLNPLNISRGATLASTSHVKTASFATTDFKLPGFISNPPEV